jgi:hypothetical protein
MSEKDSDPTLKGHARTPSGGFREKSAFAQPIKYCGRGTAIPEECKINQKS